MKIGIDISSIVYGTGVSVYTRNLVQALAKIDNKNEYLLFGGSLRRQKELHWFIDSLGRKNMTGKIFPLAPTAADFIWNKIHFLPIERLIGKIDVFHSSDWAQPPTESASITTIHDLSFLRWPESVHPKVLAAQKRRLEWVKKEKIFIIAVSEATKKEVISLLGIPEEQIFVVYEGIPEDVKLFATTPVDGETKKRLRIKFGLNRPYFLAYGSSAPRKNISRLIQAYELIRKETGYQLVIVGEYRPIKDLPEGVKLTGFLNRSQMLTLFSDAEALVSPSLYEGFGLPILEAFFLKVPVVTSNVSSMPEVAGKAAVLVNPFIVKDIAGGVRRAIKERRRLIEEGLERCRQFSWEKTARQTLEVYNKVYEARMARLT